MTTQIHRIHCVSVYWFSNIAFISIFKKINRNAHGWRNDWKCAYNTSSGKLLLASETLW